ncbi:MAG: peptide deformylase [bacterium]|nr:peptide deformylase [bacterium]
MAILSLTKHPTSSLRERSKDVEDATSKKIKKLILDMNETMIDADGIGIAAPQVGVNIRLFLVRTDTGYSAYMNPTLKGFGWKKIRFEEGCLSVPGVFGPVKRPTSLTISYTNDQGKKVTEKAKGLLARVLQHEFDHIQGILFIDKAEKLDPR